jgi:hypothetical protein
MVATNFLFGLVSHSPALLAVRADCANLTARRKDEFHRRARGPMLSGTFATRRASFEAALFRRLALAMRQWLFFEV